MSDPVFSAVLTCFNTGAYLRDGLASALREQALCAAAGVAVEVIVVDDHSSDAATLALLQELQADSAVHLLRLAHNHGVSGARNAGAATARGQWLAFLDGDDAWTAGTLLAHLQAIHQRPDLAWFASDHQRMDAQGVVIAGSQRRNHEVSALIGGVGPDSALQVLQRPVHAALSEFLCHVNACVVRSSAFDAVGGFNTALRSAEDHDLWLRLAEHHDLGYVGRVGALYRTNANSITTTTRMPHPHLPLVYWHAQARLEANGQDALAQFAGQRFRQTVLENIYHCRKHRLFGLARQQAVLLLRHAPWQASGWKHWLAATLRQD